MVYQASQAVSIPLCGIGGISSAEDAVKFLLCGATAIQVGTSNYLRPAIAGEIVDGITAADIQTSDPSLLAERWAEVLDEIVTSDEQGNPMLALDGTDLRFIRIADGRPEGLSGLDIRATDTEKALANAKANGCLSGDDLVTICGMRLRLV